MDPAESAEDGTGLRAEPEPGDEVDGGDDDSAVLGEEGEITEGGKGFAKGGGDEAVEGAGHAPEPDEFGETLVAGQEGGGAEEGGDVAELAGKQIFF